MGNKEFNEQCEFICRGDPRIIIVMPVKVFTK